MDTGFHARSPFPLCDMQAAYFVGEQGNLPLSTAAKWYREIGIGHFDLETVQDAWRRLISRHPMLRAVISTEGSQSVLEAVEPYELTFHDLRGLDEESRSKRYEEIRDMLMALDLPTHVWPQFCVHASRDDDGLRLHIRLNLWMVDATSEYIIIGELMRSCQSPGVELPEITSGFQRYAAFVEEETRGERFSSARSYWRKRLPSLPLGPLLPTKCAANDIKSPGFSHLTHTIEAGEWRSFLSNANRHGLMPNSAVLAAYTMILARWSRHKRFTITLLLSRRHSLGEMSNVVGNFGTTILLEIDATQNQSFVEFSSSLQKQLWADVRNTSFSGIAVGRELNLDRSTPLALVAPVTFTSMQIGGVEGLEEDIFGKIVQHGTRLAVPQVYLDHQLMEEPQGRVILSWDFVDGLFHDNVIEDMFSAYSGLLHTLSADPQVWLERMPMSLPPRHRQLLSNYNHSSEPCRDCTLDEMVFEQAVSRPDDLAVINGDVILSYGELARLADGVRSRLAHVEVRPGQLLGVMLPKGWQQVVSVLAITRAGGAYVPIDPDLPSFRQRQLIEQAQITVVLTSKDVASRLDLPRDIECIAVDSAERPCVALPEAGHTPDDLAYVIFTSGSTGVPKGVAINHRGAVNTIIDVNRRFGIGCTDKILSLSSLSFDLSVYDIFGVLGAGGTLIIPTPAEQQSADAWATMIARHQITIWNSVPALFGLLVDYCTPERIGLFSLRHVLLSGDWIPRSLPQRAKAVAPNANFYSLGGATEASIWSVFHKIETLDDGWASIPYGRPLSNQELYVLDDNMDQCPLWTTGELYIGGTGLAAEYLGDPERTNERFITHPRTSQRLYRTGDLGRMRPDGNIEFLGREDHQIKLRGFRIELGEVEAVILRLPAVSAAVVKVVGNSDANKRLVAFVVLKQGEFQTPESLKNDLAKFLPRYMVPELIQVLQELPLTPNGKIDYKSLDSLCTFETIQEPGEAKIAMEEELSDEVSIALRAIWEDVLSSSGVDQHSNFFALGGTSLNVLQLVARIRKQFGSAIGLADIGPNTSLASLVALIRQNNQLQSSREPTVLKLGRNDGNVGPALFCFHPVGGNSHCYMPLASRIEGDVRIFGVQAAHVTPGASVSIEEMAERYAKLALEVAADGPFMMLGWSLGAVIAVEVGRLLFDMGKNVAFVCLIDPYCARQVGARMSKRELLFAFCDDLAGLSGKAFDRSELEAVSRRMPEDQQLLRAITELAEQGILPESAPIDELREVFDVFESNTKALLNYRPQPVAMDVSVFYADSQNNQDNSYLKPWRPTAKSVSEYSCAADHFTIMREPTISVIVDTLNKKVARYQGTLVAG